MDKVVEWRKDPGSTTCGKINLDRDFQRRLFFLETCATWEKKQSSRQIRRRAGHVKYTSIFDGPTV